MMGDIVFAAEDISTRSVQSLEFQQQLLELQAKVLNYYYFIFIICNLIIQTKYLDCEWHC